MKTKLEIYGLCVCFASVICLVVSSGIAAYAAVMTGAPSFTLDRWAYERQVSNEAFWEHKQRLSNTEDKKNKPAEAELTRQRVQDLEQSLAVERHSGLQLLVKSLMFILGGAVAFWSHWRIAGRARSATNA
jgi:hypothetical protein